MAGAPEAISLLELLKETGHEMALLATYNINFPFFEHVVVPHLRSAGCRYLVLLMDAVQLSRALHSEDNRPEGAGTDYGIVPIHMPGSFHPKFIALLGRNRATLAVGSHNLTLAGFGINREVTTVLKGSERANSRSALQAVWHFTRSWSKGEVHAQKLFTRFEQSHPWLSDSDKQPDDSQVIASLPLGGPFWNQFARRISGKVESLSVVGPYFDGGLRFLRAAQEQLRPGQMTIGVDADYSEIQPSAAARMDGVNFVDLSKRAWKKASGAAVHAKVLHVRLSGGEDIVFTGSANPSFAAWLAPPQSRNAEMGVLHTGAAAEQAIEALGLELLHDLPSVDESAWERIRSRVGKTAERQAGVGARVEIAVPVEGGFAVSREFVKNCLPAQLTLLDAAAGRTLGSADQIRKAGAQAIVVCLNRILREQTGRIEASPKGKSRIALVQWLDRILENSYADGRLSIRSALRDIQSDPSMTEELFRIVEKAIFSGGSSPEPPRKKEGGDGAKSAASAHVPEKTTLAVPEREMRARGKFRRASRTGEIALLIDALLYKIGVVGGTGPGAPPPVVEPVLGDDSTATTEVEPARMREVARLFRSKTGRLMSRMARRLEAVALEECGATEAVTQLVAVIGVLRFVTTLRGKLQGCSAYEELVDSEKALKFFRDATRYAYAPRHRLARRACEELGGHEPRELAELRALLCWLAFTCGLDIAVEWDHDEEPEVERDHWTDIAYLVQVLPEAATDVESRELLLSWVNLTTSGEGWLEDNLGAGASLSVLMKKKRPAKPARAIHEGDVVIASRLAGAQPSIALWASQSQVGLVDLDEAVEKKFRSNYVELLEI